MSDSDETLVLLAQRGDKSAFAELVRRTSRLVYARLYLETGDAHRAEDCLQETLLRAWRSIRRLDDPGRLRKWLLTIAQNVAIDFARRESRQKRTPPTDNQQSHAGSETSPEDAAERDELRQRVVDALRGLPEDYRLPLTLRWIAGADYSTIETQLGLSNGALRGLLHRGMRMMRERLGQSIADVLDE